MYDFKEFEGADKWVRFKVLKEKMHTEAVKEYLKEKYNEAVAKGETRTLIEFSKGVILKDGSRLTREELEEYAKNNQLTVYSANESTTEKFLRIITH